MSFTHAVPKIPAALGAISFGAEATFPPVLGEGTFTHPVTGQEVQKVSFGTATRRYKVVDAEGVQIEWLQADHASLDPFTVYLLGQALAFQAQIDAVAIGLPIDLTPVAPALPVAEPTPE